MDKEWLDEDRGAVVAIGRRRGEFEGWQEQGKRGKTGGKLKEDEGEEESG